MNKSVLFVVLALHAGVALCESLSGSQPSAARASGLSPNAELLLLIEQLQREVQNLRGMVEEQSHELRLLKEQGRDRYRDLDGRLLELAKQRNAATVAPPITSDSGVQTPAVKSAADSSAPVIPVAKAPASSTSEDAQAEYNRAYALIGAKDYAGAVTAFTAFIERFPGAELSGNAYYWLGEIFLVQDQPEKAKQAFLVVARQFAEHRKVPDALYKLGMTSLRLEDKAQAEQYLKEVVTRFPVTSSAKLAQEQLAKLR